MTAPAVVLLGRPINATHNQFILRSQMHSSLSVMPVTNMSELAYTKFTKVMAAMLLLPTWLPRANTTSPLLRLTTQMPPSEPQMTAMVNVGSMPGMVMPPRLNWMSSLVGLKSRVSEGGTH